MTDRDTTEFEQPQSATGTTHAHDDLASIVSWLEDEFPGWEITIDQTATWEGELKPIWIARQEGHHPQAELTAAKLHTRLTEYLAREDARQAMMN